MRYALRHRSLPRTTVRVRSADTVASELHPISRRSSTASGARPWPARSFARLVLCGWLTIAGGLLAEAGENTPTPGSISVSRNGFVYRYAVKPNGLPETAAFGRAVAGRFNEDPRVDVAVLRDDAPLLFVNPSQWDAALRLPTSARDLARYADTGTHGFDELLAVGPDGLRGWTRRSDSDSYDVRSIGRDSIWRAVGRLYVAEIDGLHGPDIIGLGVDGSHLVILRASETGFENETVVPLAAPATSVVVAWLRPSELPWFVTTGPTGLQVYRGNGDLMASFPDAVDGWIDRFRITPVEQAVVWIGKNAQGIDELRVLRDTDLDGPLAFGPVDVGGAAMGDLDLDGDDDLVIARGDENGLLWIENDSGTLQGTGIRRHWNGAEIPFAESAAVPVLADLDGDRDLDVFFPIQGVEEIVVVRNTRRNAWAETPRLAGPVLFNLLSSSPQGQVLQGILQIQLRDGAFVPDGATHVELVIWKKPDLMTPTNSTPKPEHRFRFEVGERYRTGPIVLANPESSVYFWSQQYVRLDPLTHKRLEMYPPLNYAFTVEWDVESELIEWLIEENSGFVYKTTEPDPALQTGPPQNETVSTIVKIDPLISYDDDEEPEDDFDF